MSPAALTSSFNGRWRVVSESDTNVLDVSEGALVVNRVPTVFYVNDGATNGDVYTTATGHSLNSGLSPGTPMDTVQRVIDAYDLEPGDEIRVDTAHFTYTGMHFIVTAADQGAPGNPVTIRGSTNDAAGGTVFDSSGAPPNSRVIQLNYSFDMAIRNIRVCGTTYGLDAFDADGLLLEDVVAVSNSAAGITLFGCANVRMVRCVSAANAIGLEVRYSGGNWESGVLWSNTQSAIQLELPSPMFGISNSIIAQGPGYVYRNSPHMVSGDYNIFLMAPGAQLSFDGGLEVHTRLSAYQKTYNREWHSSVFDPLVANPSALDFHLQSAAGRYVSGAGWTNDAATSGAIDFGPPGMAFTNEPAPAGSRVNAGAHANTAQASKSLTNAWLRALTLNDGGSIAGTSYVAWAASRAIGPTNTVRIEVSIDDGGTWSAVASNLAVLSEIYAWDTTLTASSGRSRWRVLLEADTNVADVVDTRFTIHNSALNYYVNDTNPAGDVVTAAPGSSTNTGTAADQPMESLQRVLDTYDLEPGDTVWIDTAFFGSSNTLVNWQSDDIGSQASPLILQGSSNMLAGGTVFQSSNSVGLYFNYAHDVVVRNFTARRCTTGIYAYQCNRILFERFTALSNTQAGMTFYSCPGALVRSSVASRNNLAIDLPTGSLTMDGIVLWKNGSGIYAPAALGYISNSILVADSGQIYSGSIGTTRGDHNVVHLTGSAKFFFDGVTPAPLLSDYQRLTGRELHSTTVDPAFEDPEALDFHLRSTAGRFDPATSSFVTDTNDSPAIDFGNPSAAFAAEPAPNGSRVNAGMHGNTPEASKSRTNAWLLALSFSDGGTISSNETLRWIAQNFTNGATVRIEYSANGGTNWSTVAGGIDATGGVYVVSPASLSSSFNGRWRVVSESDGSVADASDAPIVVNRIPVVFYVNDDSTSGDVYTAAAGNDGYSGLGPSAPMRTMSNLLAKFTLVPGDLVLIDTGVHSNYSFVVAQSGTATNPIVIRGSTNQLAGGTVFDRGNSSAVVITLAGVSYVAIEDLTVKNGQTGVHLPSSTACTLNRIAAVGNVNGYRGEGSSGHRFNRCVAALNSIGYSLFNNDNIWNHGVSWNNGSAFAPFTGSSVSISNSVIVGGQAFAGSAPHAGDYNVFWNTDILPGTYKALSGLQNDKDGWRHSTYADPMYLATTTNLDFHEASPSGRYDPSIAGFVTTDAQFSALIDLGNPASAVGAEQGPNGSRANVGLYGGTLEASKSRTNAWLMALTFNDGGLLRGTGSLYWTSGGLAPTSTVRLEYSGDQGASWSIIATAIPGSNGVYAWNASAVTSTPVAYWKVVNEGDPAVSDTNDSVFAIKGTTNRISYFVNDAVTAGDVYATAAGSAANSGVAPASPKATVQELLAVYDLDAGDIVYVDTGLYVL
ncbi:MAG TPA: right-handed parallel beta-helix repeat-containing protein, partial [Kiritimatiellia bacterium]